MERTITIGEHKIRLETGPLGDYLSLTDLAKMVNEDTSRVISKWIELIRTLDFLDTWEREFNPGGYDTAGFAELRGRAGVPSFFLSPKQWAERTGAIGIESKGGRGGGTWAHHLIALEFCSTMDAEFRFRVFREYTALRSHEAENWLRAHQFFLQKIEGNAMENNRFAAAMLEEARKLGKP